uniref:Uncharacterized protein n=1 Tax=Glossina palpalis gambiensis TaxID=67801 RepID=A0A1B0C6M0_9MUSC
GQAQPAAIENARPLLKAIWRKKNHKTFDLVKLFHTRGSGMPPSGKGGQHLGVGEHGIGDGAPHCGLDNPQ